MKEIESFGPVIGENLNLLQILKNYKETGLTGNPDIDRMLTDKYHPCTFSDVLNEPALNIHPLKSRRESLVVTCAHLMNERSGKEKFK